MILEEEILGEREEEEANIPEVEDDQIDSKEQNKPQGMEHQQGINNISDDESDNREMEEVKIENRIDDPQVRFQDEPNLILDEEAYLKRIEDTAEYEEEDSSDYISEMDSNVQDRHICEENKILEEDVDEDDEILDEENEETRPTSNEPQWINPQRASRFKKNMWGCRTDTEWQHSY